MRHRTQLAATLKAVEGIIPPFSSALHKGHHGRIGVVGGCFEYTGAPFYAAMSALKAGVDLSHVFCTEDAAVPIKAYSPELIVHPVLRTSRAGTDAPSRAGGRASPSPTCPTCGRPAPAAGTVTGAAPTTNRMATSARDAARCAVDRGGAAGAASGAAAGTGAGAGAPASAGWVGGDILTVTSADVEAAMRAVRPWLSRLDSLVVGPGLGRDANVLACARAILLEAKAMHLPIVVDADALWLVAQDVSVVMGNTNAVLTPNAVELARLWQATAALGGSPRARGSGGAQPTPLTAKAGASPHDEHTVSGSSPDAAILARRLGNVTVLCKGAADTVTDGTGTATTVDVAGSPRRCGGQGDVVAGVVGTFLAWAHSASRRQAAVGSVRPVCTAPESSEHATPTGGAGGGAGEGCSSASADSGVEGCDTTADDRSADALPTSSSSSNCVLAAVGGSAVVRHAAAIAFSRGGRSTTTPDIMAALGVAFEAVFPDSRHADVAVSASL